MMMIKDRINSSSSPLSPLKGSEKHFHLGKEPTVAGKMIKDAVANAVVSLYNELPENGKPKKDLEFTVVAAICAFVDGVDNPFVLSLATGTKCAGKQKEDNYGYILSDGHAEVLARRGFIRWLLKNAIAAGQNVGTSSALDSDMIPFEFKRDNEVIGSTLQRLDLKPGWRFFLFTSDSPCGDASIYPRALIGSSANGFTGAKIVRSEGDSSVCNWEREEEQEVGLLRTKSGRSDIESIHRTSSMCCSDKVCRWMRLGLQGALVPLIVRDQSTRPLFPLSGVIVGYDPTASSEEAQLSALRRALIERSQAHSLKPETCLLSHYSNFSVEVVGYSSNVPCSKGAADKRHFEFLSSEAATTLSDKDKQKAKPSPCGTSINWIRDVCSVGARATKNTAVPNDGLKDAIEAKRKRLKPCAGGTCEVTMADTGALQGATKAAIGTAEASSRLCKKEIATLFGLAVSSLCASGPRQQPQQHQASEVAPDKAQASTDNKGADITPSGVDSIEEPSVTVTAMLREPYYMWKQRDPRYATLKNEFLSVHPFCNWLCDDPIASGSFDLVPTEKKTKPGKEVRASRTDETEVGASIEQTIAAVVASNKKKALTAAQDDEAGIGNKRAKKAEGSEGDKAHEVVT